jgi:hypothetical protein
MGNGPGSHAETGGRRQTFEGKRYHVNCGTTRTSGSVTPLLECNSNPANKSKGPSARASRRLKAAKLKAAAALEEDEMPPTSPSDERTSEGRPGKLSVCCWPTRFEPPLHVNQVFSLVVSSMEIGGLWYAQALWSGDCWVTVPTIDPVHPSRLSARPRISVRFTTWLNTTTRSGGRSCRPSRCSRAHGERYAKPAGWSQSWLRLMFNVSIRVPFRRSLWCLNCLFCKGGISHWCGTCATDGPLALLSFQLSRRS